MTFPTFFCNPFITRRDVRTCVCTCDQTRRASDWSSFGTRKIEPAIGMDLNRSEFPTFLFSKVHHDSRVQKRPT